MLLDFWCAIVNVKRVHKGPKLTELLPKGASQPRTPVSVNLVLSVRITSTTEG